ncbi:orexin receptor type 2-like [Macrobrachium nipponense]|uniref:orexin receptor type 2-like n=1 Tax=Macrobrachium nipponense TaxID=159736 RepID=UPI0030C841B5
MVAEANYSGLFSAVTTTSPEELNGSFPSEVPLIPAWPCNHTGALVMREKFPFPALVEAARTLDYYEIMQVVLIVFVFIFSVCGNLIVMIVVYQNSFLRSTVNYYLVNLAVSDLLITVLCWPTITSQITKPVYILGRPLCKINVLTQTTCVTASVMTLSAVACDRVYAVMLPLRARSSAARPLTLIVVIWIIAVTLAIPAFLVRDVQVFQWDDFVEESCSDIMFRCNMNASVVFRYYRILLAVMIFFIPAIVMVAAYAIILLRLWCVKRPTVHAPSYSTAPLNPHMRAKRKIVILTALVLLAFLICWCPLHILHFYDIVNHHPLPAWFANVEFWAYFLGYCNSALNPLLYGGFSDNFRLGFRNLFQKKRSTSDQFQLPSTAVATSLSLNRGSSIKFTFHRKSLLLPTFSNPLSLSSKGSINNGLSRYGKASQSRRSSETTSNQQLSRQCSLSSTGTVLPAERAPSGSQEGLLTNSPSFQFSSPDDSPKRSDPLGFPSARESQAKDERKALLCDSPEKKDCGSSNGLFRNSRNSSFSQRYRRDTFSSISEEASPSSD